MSKKGDVQMFSEIHSMFQVSNNIMRLDLFCENDNVLLLGEGNFSFSVCLHKHKLPISITATCFEKELSLKEQQKNVEYLKLNEVPVFLNVDATKLHENPNFFGKLYSKIVFNFPHIGGKMKIHLNRELLRKTFESSSHIIDENGLMIVSLCKGQGGTPSDKPQRKWDDSWQITEMAAHGDFILTSVEPFKQEYFKDYTCIGYRSQDVKFNLEGALVHIFKKEKPPYTCLNEKTVIERLSFVDLAENSNVSVPIIYSELYNTNPMLNPKSPVSFLKDLLVKNLQEMLPMSELKVITDESIPVYVESKFGVSCEVNDNKTQFSLRLNAFQILQSVIQLLDVIDVKSKIIFFPGMYFNPILDKDFTSAPIKFQFLILGENLTDIMYKFTDNLVSLFKEKNLTYSMRPKCLSGDLADKIISSVESITELVFNTNDQSKDLTAAFLLSLRHNGMNIDVCIINIDVMCKYFFKISDWKEIWAEKNEVFFDTEGKPTLKQMLMYPSTYKFDITLRFNSKEVFSESQMYKILWLAAGKLIEGVEFVNDFISDKDWSSKCYRIIYKSLDKPLFRNRVVDLHSIIVGKMLEQGLNVIIA